MVALSSDGRVFTVGNPDAIGRTGPYDQVGLVTFPGGTMPIKSVAVGYHYTFAIAEDDKLYSWSTTAGLALGHTNNGSFPSFVNITLPIYKLVLGLSTSAIITPDYKMWTWGSNAGFNMMLRTSADTPLPGLAQVPGNRLVKDCSMAQHSGIIVTLDGKVYTYGEWESGNIKEWTLPAGAGIPDKVATGATCHHVIDSKKLLYTVGYDPDIGRTTSVTPSNALGLVTSFQNVTMSTTGDHLAAAFLEDGSVYTFGYPQNVGRVGGVDYMPGKLVLPAPGKIVSVSVKLDAGAVLAIPA